MQSFSFFCCPESSKLEYPVENFRLQQPQLHRLKWGLKLKLRFRSRTTAPSLPFPVMCLCKPHRASFPAPRPLSSILLSFPLFLIGGLPTRELPLIPKESFQRPQTLNTSSTVCSYSTPMNCHVHSSLFITFYCMSCSCWDLCCHNFVVAIFHFHSVDFMLDRSLCEHEERADSCCLLFLSALIWCNSCCSCSCSSSQARRINICLMRACVFSWANARGRT